MAMREIENMFDELDHMNQYYISRHGAEMPHLFGLQTHIDLAVDLVIDSFNSSVEESRKMLKLDRKKLNGEMSLDMYTKKRDDILKNMERAEFKGENALKDLNSYADTLGVERPQGKHMNAYSFARELVGEYHAFSHAYLKAQKRAIQYDVPFVLNEHAPHSKAIMDLANDSIKIVKKAMKEGVLPSDMFDNIAPSPYLGKEDMIVRSGLGNIANDEPWQNVNALVGVIRFDNAQKDTVSVPAIYYPDRNVYLISEKDYEEKIAKVGQPIAKVDIEIPDHYEYKPMEDVNLNRISTLKDYGYDAHSPKEDRQYILKALLDEGVLNKQQMQRYFDFRVNVAKTNRYHANMLETLQEDKEFVDSYVPQTEVERKVDSLKIKPKNRGQDIDR